MRTLVIAAVLGGCYSPSPPMGAPCGDGNVCPTGQQCVAGYCGGSATDDSGGGSDGDPSDAAVCTTWNAQHFAPCALPTPFGDLNLTEALGNFDWSTTSGALTGRMNTTINVVTTMVGQTGGPEVLLASVNNFTLEAGATLSIDGTRPLLIAVNGTATIEGTINVAATFTSAGPGGSAMTTEECMAPTGGNGANGTPATGGGGGAFQGAGGRGGNLGGDPGQPVAAPTVIRGGCAGGEGGAGSTLVSPRGAGGGAIVISARTAILIGSGGLIRAGGGGGSFGRATYGAGGGGGSGGLIGLDSPSVTVAGVLAANGGSGGGGASDVAEGSTGLNALSSATARAGGAGATTTNIGACGSGGDGSSQTALGGLDGQTSACGGGGGGGGAGYILVWSALYEYTGTVSPPAVVDQ